MQVGAADAAGGHLEQHLPGPGSGFGSSLLPQRLAGAVQNHRAHLWNATPIETPPDRGAIFRLLSRDVTPGGHEDAEAQIRSRTLAVTAATPVLALALAVPAAPAAKPVARAKLADKARNAVRVGGIAVSRKPRPGHLLPLSRSGRFPASTLTSILSSSLLQRPLTSACPAGQFIRSVTREGEVTCQAAADITGVTAGAGLSGGGTSGDVELSLAPPLRFQMGAVRALIDLDNTGTGPAILGISRSAWPRPTSATWARTRVRR